MTDHEKECLQEELLELEGLLLQCREKAEKIADVYGIRIIAMDPMWSTLPEKYKIHVQLSSGIYEAAYALGKDVKIAKATFSGPENAEFTSRGCGWVQLPEYDVPRYRRAGR